MNNGMSRSEAGRLGWEKSIEKRKKINEERIKKYQENPKRCLFCNEVISYACRRSNFCNRSCSAKHNNKGVRRWGEEPGLCLNCNKKLSVSRKKYCNNKCQQEHRWKKEKDIIKSGKWRTNCSWTRPLRRYLIEERGHKCEKCSLSLWMGQPIPLVCDHINGDASDNSPENLRLICNNCDALNPTYKGRNRGKGRAARRLYRKEYEKKNGFYY